MIKTDSILEGSHKSLNFFDEHFYIHGYFDETISTEILPHLVKKIDEKKSIKDAKIRFYINSQGGYTKYLKELITMIDVAKSCGIVVETYVMGVAFSCASALAVSGTMGYRYVGQHAEHLCHLGAGWTFSTNDTELARNTKMLKAHFDFVRAIYKKNCNIKNLDEVIHDDCLFVRGSTLIKWGLADHFLI